MSGTNNRCRLNGILFRACDLLSQICDKVHALTSGISKIIIRANYVISQSELRNVNCEKLSEQEETNICAVTVFFFFCFYFSERRRTQLVFK